MSAADFNTIRAALNIRHGDRGPEVGALQRILNSQGASLTVDDHFGDLTLGAVQRYQGGRGLKPDGVVGSSSYALLLADAGLEPAGGRSWCLPVAVSAGRPYAVLTSAYGNRTHPISGNVRHHNGIDLRARQGAPLLACADGEVVRIDTDTSAANGLAVFIRTTSSRDLVAYLHCSRIHVRLGQRVICGEHIADSGDTGSSTAPHLHFQVYDPAGQLIDPRPLFRASQIIPKGAVQ